MSERYVWSVLYKNLCCGDSLEAPCLHRIVFEALLISIYNIGFYEEMSKII